MPIGNSYTPGRRQSPETLNSFWPVDFSVPMPLNHLAPLGQNAHDPGERLDVVDDRRVAEVSGVDGERGAVAGLAALAFERFDQGRLFAADVGPGAHADFDVEVEALLPADVLSQQVLLAAAAEDGFQVRAEVGVLRAQVDDALAGADHQGPDGHALEHQVGELGEDDAVFEGAGLAFVGVADDVLAVAGALGGQFPFQAGGEAGAAAAAEARGRDSRQGVGRRPAAAPRPARSAARSC